MMAITGEKKISEPRASQKSNVRLITRSIVFILYMQSLVA